MGGAGGCSTGGAFFVGEPEHLAEHERRLTRGPEQGGWRDDIDGRRAVASGFSPCVRREGPGGDDQALVGAPLHRPAKIAHGSGAYGALVTLALEEDVE